MPTSSSTNRDRRVSITSRSMTLASIAATLLVSPARASVYEKQNGQMRALDCAPVASEYAWPLSSQPTFTAYWESCGIFYRPDGGSYDVCSRSARTVDVSKLVMHVEDKIYGGNTFEDTASLCDGARLVRYKGPLHPGAVHQIYLQNTVLSFRAAVNGASDGASDAAAGRASDADAPADVGGSAADERGETGGSRGCAVGRTRTSRSDSGVALLLTALALVVCRRRFSPRTLADGRGRRFLLTLSAQAARFL